MSKTLERAVALFTNIAQPLVLLVLRLVVGVSFYHTGHGKLSHLNDTAQFFADLGIPAPHLQAAFVGSLEMVGGILLVIGLLSRPAALLLSGTMGVALLTAHRAATLGIISDPNEFLGQAPVPFLMTTLVVLAFGAGKLSADTLLAPALKKLMHIATAGSPEGLHGGRASST